MRSNCLKYEKNKQTIKQQQQQNSINRALCTESNDPQCKKKKKNCDGYYSLPPERCLVLLEHYFSEEIVRNLFLEQHSKGSFYGKIYLNPSPDQRVG